MVREGNGARKKFILRIRVRNKSTYIKSLLGETHSGPRKKRKVAANKRTDAKASKENLASLNARQEPTEQRSGLVVETTGLGKAPCGDGSVEQIPAAANTFKPTMVPSVNVVNLASVQPSRPVSAGPEFGSHHGSTSDCPDSVAAKEANVKVPHMHVNLEPLANSRNIITESGKKGRVSSPPGNHDCHDSVAVERANVKVSHMCVNVEPLASSMNIITESGKKGRVSSPPGSPLCDMSAPPAPAEKRARKVECHLQLENWRRNELAGWKGQPLRPVLPEPEFGSNGSTSDCHDSTVGKRVNVKVYNMCRNLEPLRLASSMNIRENGNKGSASSTPESPLHVPLPPAPTEKKVCKVMCHLHLEKLGISELAWSGQGQHQTKDKNRGKNRKRGRACNYSGKKTQ